jgi:hypothetical protein
VQDSCICPRGHTNRSPGAKVMTGGTRPRRPSTKRSASGAVPAQRTTPACTPRRWCQAQSAVRLASSPPPPAERSTM